MVKKIFEDEFVLRKLVSNLSSADLYEFQRYGFDYTMPGDKHENFKEWVLSIDPQSQPYKLTENEVTELRYFRMMGIKEILYRSANWRYRSEDYYIGLNNHYSNLDKTKTYSIEELLANHEVVEC